MTYNGVTRTATVKAPLPVSLATGGLLLCGGSRVGAQSAYSKTEVAYKSNCLKLKESPHLLQDCGSSVLTVQFINGLSDFIL